jgi:hypothetical protein
MKHRGESFASVRQFVQLSRFFAFGIALAERYRLLLAVLLILVNGLSLIPMLDAPTRSDVLLYRALHSAISDGKVPYRDHEFEYPPYAIPLFLLPSVMGDRYYVLVFKLLVLAADALIMCVLLIQGLRNAIGIRALVPLASYCIAVPFLRHFFLQRYDVFPAATSLFAVWAFSSKRYTLAGVLVALGAGIKLYPILFAPPLLSAALRQGRARQFLLGLAYSSIPIVLLSPVLPWWRFLAFHSRRGLEVESLYASVLWFGHLCGGVDVAWTRGYRCMELSGSLADAVLPWTRASFFVALGTSIALACLGAARAPSCAAPTVMRFLLPPLLAFIGFNQVLSAGFMIWLLPLTALVSLARGSWIMVAVLFATVLTSVFCDSIAAHGGLRMLETQALVGRNVILVLVWARLTYEQLMSIRGKGQTNGQLL